MYVHANVCVRASVRECVCGIHHYILLDLVSLVTRVVVISKYFSRSTLVLS